jgi:CRP-like cAMP-binding protein
MAWWRKKREVPAWREAAVFAGLEPGELTQIVELARERSLAAGETLLEEGEPGRSVYLVVEGTLEVVKRRDRGGEHRLGVAKAGDFLGEAALFEDLPRAASVRAGESAKVVEIPLAELHRRAAKPGRSDRHAVTAYQKIVLNIAAELANRLRSQADQLVASAREREVMGRFIVNVLVLLCAYVFFVAGLTEYAAGGPANTSYVSIPLQLLFALGAWAFIRSTGHPLSRFGMSWRHLLSSVGEAVVFTIPVLAFLTGVKWLAIVFGATPDQPIVAHPDVLARLREPEILPLLAAYAVSSAVQELIVRGGLQSSLAMFLVGPHRLRNAVFVSALLFAVMHLHMSFLFAALAFVPGVFWGWLFARRPNLVGVTLSHVAVGGYVFFILGVQL